MPERSLLPLPEQYTFQKHFRVDNTVYIAINDLGIFTNSLPTLCLFKDFTVDQNEDFFFRANEDASLRLKILSWPLLKRRISYLKRDLEFS